MSVRSKRGLVWLRRRDRHERASSTGLSSRGCSPGRDGLVIGTATFPIVGTAFGVVYGAVVGAGLGLLNGVVLSASSRWTSRRSVFAIAAGLICGVSAAILTGGWQRALTSGWQPPVFVAWCIGLGVVLGPAVVRTGGGSGRRRDATRLVQFVVYGAAIAAMVGAVAGFAVGLAAYAPTAPFALVEGALLASPTGALAGAFAAFIPPRRRADQR